MKILCSGDLHIGRGSSKIAIVCDRAFTCSAAWDRVVDCAITNNAGLVLLRGDLVDRANRRYVANGALERGMVIMASLHALSLDPVSARRAVRNSRAIDDTSSSTISASSVTAEVYD